MRLHRPRDRAPLLLPVGPAVPPRAALGSGGEHQEGNLALYCQTHNLLAARRDFGQEFIARRINEAGEPAASTEADAHSPRGERTGGGASRAGEPVGGVYIPSGWRAEVLWDLPGWMHAYEAPL